MPANFDSGFTVREPAWHGMGNVLDKHPENWGEARVAAGLEWEPTERTAYLRDRDADGNELDTYTPESDFKRIVRSDTNATLAVTSAGYQLIDHTEMGQIVEALLDQAGVKYETAGSLDGGRKVWALAYLDEPITLPGDNSQTFPYLALLNQHDGKGACKALPTSVRIVCQNTFSAAEAQGDRSGAVFSFRHSAQWRDRVQEARDAIHGLRTAQAAYLEVAEALLHIPTTDEQVETFIQAFIPSPPNGVISPRVQTNIERDRQFIRAILAGPTSVTTHHTAYGLVQAAGEFLDHYRGTRGDQATSKLGRQLLRPEPLKFKAIKLVREIVTV